MKSLYSALLLSATLAFGACNNDDDIQNVTPSGPYTSLGEVLNTNGAPAQTFNVDADTGGTFVAARGTRFRFPPRGFSFPNGDSVRGTVQVTVQEFLDRSEFIFSRVLPVSGSTPLVSGGAFFAAAKQSNRAVKTKAPYVVYLPQRNFATDASGLTDFVGTQMEGFVNTVGWTPNFRLSGVAATAIDTLGLLVDTLGYHQAAAAAPFFGGPNDDATVKFNITGPSGINETNSYLYLLPVRQRQVIPIGSAGETLKKATYTTIKDREINLVAIAVVNGNFYGAILTTKIENNKTYTLNVTDAVPLTFKASVMALL